MNKKNVISEKRVFDSIYLTLLFIFFSILIFIFNDSFENQTLNKVVEYGLFFLMISLIYLSKRVSIHNGFLVKEIRTSIGKVKNIEKFHVSEIVEVFLNQNDERYFEITVKRKNDSNFIIKKCPNKNPALKELELIKEYLKSPNIS